MDEIVAGGDESEVGGEVRVLLFHGVDVDGTDHVLVRADLQTIRESIGCSFISFRSAPISQVNHSR